jgi:hypothetical protein
MVAWIDVQATKDAIVKVMLDGNNNSLGFFRVMSVYPPNLTDEQLSEKQKYDRRGFPSLEGV